MFFTCCQWPCVPSQYSSYRNAHHLHKKALIKNAREQDKIEAYSRYLEKYPRGRFAEESEEAILYFVYISDKQCVDELLEKDFVDNSFKSQIYSVCDYKAMCWRSDLLEEHLKA